MDLSQFVFTPSVIQKTTHSNVFPMCAQNDSVAIVLISTGVRWCRADCTGIKLDRGTWHKHSDVIEFVSSHEGRVMFVTWNFDGFSDWTDLLPHLFSVERAARMRCGIWSTRTTTMQDVETRMCDVHMQNEEERLINIYTEGQFRGWW